MRNGMKGNPEESLLRALAELADETGLGMAPERVRQRLRYEVRAKAHRRWAIAGLAAAAVLSAIVFGITTRSGLSVASPHPQAVAQGNRAPVTSTAPPAPVASAVHKPELQAAVRTPAANPEPGSARLPLPSNPKRGKGIRPPTAAGDWRRGEVVLSPWYFNTALPPSARSVMVRSEVDARTAMRFGVVSAGGTAPVEILFGEDGLPRAMRFVRRLPVQQN